MDNRFIIRRESQGAYVFHVQARKVTKLDQEEFASLSTYKSNSLSSIAHYFDARGKPLYRIIDPLAGLSVPPAQSALLSPNRIYLELTRRCVQNCAACYNDAGEALDDELKYDEWSDLISCLADAGVFEFRFTGGEPTIHPHFEPLLNKAIKTGRYVSVGTCGVMPHHTLEMLASAFVDEIIVSYQGKKEIHDAFAGVSGSHERTVKSIRTFRSSGRKVRLNLTLTQSTYRGVEDAFAFADELGIETINLIHARPLGRGQRLTDCMTAQDNLEHNRNLNDIRGKYRVKVMTDFDLLRPEDETAARHPITERITSCPAGREFAFISPEGYVFPCGVAPVAHVSRMTPEERSLFLSGSVREQTFLNIWHTSPTWIPYRDLDLCKPDTCRRCSHWGRKCYGSCPVGAYLSAGRLDGEDPYCYAHLLSKEEDCRENVSA